MPPPSLDVIVPSVRPATVGRLLESLALGSVRPDAVSIVSNEVEASIETHGLDVRLLRFRSSEYPIGDRDVALRRDVGIWSSEHSHVLTLDDDVVAPANLIETSRALLADEPYFWGHYRYISFPGYALERLVELPPELGRRRENPPNSWHLWMSCYAGAFVWHPTELDEWEPPRYSNLCDGEHDLEEAEVNGLPVASCRRCPWFVAADESRLFSGEVLVPFDPAAVEVTVERPSTA